MPAFLVETLPIMVLRPHRQQLTLTRNGKPLLAHELAAQIISLRDHVLPPEVRFHIGGTRASLSTTMAVSPTPTHWQKLDLRLITERPATHRRRRRRAPRSADWGSITITVSEDQTHATLVATSRQTEELLGAFDWARKRGRLS
jgi:hypothetical protein